MVIQKYPLQLVTGLLLVDMPCLAVLLCVKVQNYQPVLYALVDEDVTLLQKHLVLALMTGEPSEDVGGANNYLGTLEFRNGVILHYFDIGPND